MKKTTLLTLFLGLLLLIVAGLIVKKTLLKPVNAGLQVKSVPASNILLNGKDLGKTPYDNNQLQAGDAVLKLIPENTTGSYSPWESKIKLVGGTQTTINWEFGERDGLAAGEILTLEPITDKKNSALTIVSSQDSSLVKMGSETKGFTPLSVDKLEPGSQTIILSATGYSERTVEVKLLAGYRLIVNVKLAEQTQANNEPEASPSGTPAPTATPSVKTSPTPTPKASPTPKPTGKITPSPTTLAKPYVTIKETPTGYLRVRSEPNTGATEVARVNPGESYPLVGQQTVSGTVWYKITYAPGKTGWISGQYAQKFE